MSACSAAACSKAAVHAARAAACSSAVTRASYDGERLVVRGRGAHLLLAERDSYHKARLGNTWVERRLGVATNRNATVIRTLADRWGG